MLFQFHVVQGSGMSCVFPVPFLRPSSLSSSFSQFLFQFLLRMCCVFQGILLQSFFFKKNEIFFFSRKEGLQQKPLKNTTHPQKELEKELGKELEGNWDGQMELGHSHYPGQKMELEKHRTFHFAERKQKKIWPFNADWQTGRRKSRPRRKEAEKTRHM